MVKLVKSYGAPIHGVGMQAHLTTGQVGAASQYVSNMQAYVNLGVEVAYTELDIQTPSSSPNFAQQATDFATIVSACKQVSACVGITTWGFTDKYTWISNSYPLIWDTSLQKKAAYNAILNAWSGTAASTTTSSAAAATSTAASGGGSGCTAAKYAQCGGQGYTGCTNCVAGTTCQATNNYYSQCL